MILEVLHDIVTAGMFAFGIEVVGRQLLDDYDKTKAEEEEEDKEEGNTHDNI